MAGARFGSAAVYLVAPLLITWIGAADRPIFNERYIIAAAPGFALLVTAGMSPTRLFAGRKSHPLLDRGLALAGVVLAAFLLVAMSISLARLYGDPAYSKSLGWRQFAAVMARSTGGAAAATTRVAQTFPDPTLWYYYRDPVDRLVIPPVANDQAAADAIAGDLVEQGVQRVVLAVTPSDNWDSNEIGPRALQTEYSLSLEVPVGDGRVQVYDRPPDDLPAVNAPFANGMRLAAAATGLQRLIPGDVLPVWLDWEGNSDELTGTEKLTLQLLDENGKLAAQTDQAIGAADFAAGPAGYTLALPRTLAPGNYRLILAVYNPAEQGAPRLLTLEGKDHVELGTLPGPTFEDVLFD